MKIVDQLKLRLSPVIDVPGITDEQKRRFVLRNFLIGGRVTADNPSQLDRITGNRALLSNIRVGTEGVQIRASWNIGSRIDIE